MSDSELDLGNCTSVDKPAEGSDRDELRRGVAKSLCSRDGRLIALWASQHKLSSSTQPRSSRLSLKPALPKPRRNSRFSFPSLDFFPFRFSPLLARIHRSNGATFSRVDRKDR